MKDNRVIGIIYAYAAAIFYALNVPCSKLLLDEVPPTFLASFLYLGAGIGVGLMYLLYYPKEASEVRLKKGDEVYTVLMILLDILAPILLMIGVKLGTASNASLLGNFEIVATTLIAFLLFKERVSNRLWCAILLVILSSSILSFEGTESFSFSIGSVFVLGATICWGLENNCTRRIADRSTYQIVTIKGLCSGMGSFIVAILLRESLPQVKYILISMVLGYIAYGLSIFTYIRAQKELGASRTSAYYAIAPFVGVALSTIFLHEKLSIAFIVALFIMILGTILIVYDSLIHKHYHVHIHVFTHMHDGNVHTHIVQHDHSHKHLLSEDNHSHTHSIEELEKELHHSGV
ncbi:MAG: DMT family transporter [Pseudobutyrivibrio sp.]|nr:DMT family transporter [Pseudobutyrivibrio sp.]